MPNTNTSAVAIKGFIPALDPKVVNVPHVVDGRNFLMSVEGPWAGFASKLLSYQPFVSEGSVATFESDIGTIWCAQDGIYQYNPDIERFDLLYPLDTNADGVWSYAYVGGVNYLCNPDVGVLRWVSETAAWGLLAHAELPQSPQYVAAAYGRLLVVGVSRVAWSALDDGTDFTSSLTTGVGSQGLSMVGGRGMVVKAVADGVIVFTSAGILRGRFTDIGSTFVWSVLSTQRKLLNQRCVVTVVNVQSADTELNHVFLDARAGMFICTGATPVPYQPLMSEYLSAKLLPAYGSAASNTVALYYSTNTRNLVVSIGKSEFSDTYTYALVLYTSRDEWGRFDEPHRSFCDFSVALSYRRGGDHWAHVTSDGYVQYMVPGLGHIETVDVDPMASKWLPANQYPGYSSGSTWRAVSCVRLTSVDEQGYLAAMPGFFRTAVVVGTSEPDITSPSVAGYAMSEYVLNEDWNYVGGAEDWNVDGGAEDLNSSGANLIAPAVGFFASGVLQYNRVMTVPAIAGLSSWVDVGLFRLTQKEYPDEVSMITNVALGIAVGAADITVEDWNSMAVPAEDWSLLGGADDYGRDVPDGSCYTAHILGTNDGVTTSSMEQLSLVTDTPAVEYYACFSNAIFHKVRVAASAPKETYHLRYLELSGSVAGRL